MQFQDEGNTNVIYPLINQHTPLSSHWTDSSTTGQWDGQLEENGRKLEENGRNLEENGRE